MKHFPLRRLLSSALFVLCAGITAAAAAAPDASDCALRVATGPAGKIYERAFSDMLAVCGAKVAICPVPSEGGLQNLSLLASNQADLGMVQVDTLTKMRQGGDEGIASLEAVLPMHMNLLHVLTAAEGSMVETKYAFGMPVPLTGHKVVITKFSQLRGMKVAAVGSAHLSALELGHQYNLGLNIVDVETDAEAIAQLRAGAVQAVWTLGGWPTPSIDKLRPDAGVTLADFDLSPQDPYRVVKRSYQNLGAYNFRFIAVPNLLVTRAFKAGGEYARHTAELQRCLLQHLDELQEGRHNPLWREVKDINDTFGVPPFPGAQSRVADTGRSR